MLKFIKLTLVNDLEPGNDGPARMVSYINAGHLQSLTPMDQIQGSVPSASTKVLIRTGGHTGLDEFHVAETVGEILAQL